MKCAVRVLVLAAAGLAVSAARAQGEVDAPRPRPNVSMFAPASAGSARPMSAQEREERQFLRDAAATGRFEAEASRMALAKSDSSVVRSFASTLIRHHAAAGNDLQYMLQARGMAPPMLANDKRKSLNRLARLQGTKFDREYMAQVGMKNQQEGVQTFERAGLATRDPQLKAWIERTLPNLRFHLATGGEVAPATALVAKTGNAGPAVSRASWPSASRSR